VPNPSHTYESPGDYTVTLTAILAFISDTEIKRDFIHVAPAPLLPDFTAEPPSGVNPHTVTFTDTSTGAAPTAWLWAFGDGGTSTDQDPVHTYTTPGTYTVSLTAFVGDQSETVTKSDLIEVTPVPLVPGFTADPLVGLGKLSTSFVNTSTGVEPDSFLWDFGDGTSSTKENPTHTYTVPGTYTVSLTIGFLGQSETFVMSGPMTLASSVCQTTALHADDGAINDDLGFSVSTDGVHALVAAPPNGEVGRAYLFDMKTGQQVAQLLPGGGATGDGIADSVAVDGSLALIGASADDDLGPNAGAAYLFDISRPTSPIEIAKLLASDGAEGDRFGWSVAIEGSVLLISAIFDDDHGVSSGSAYLFDVSDPAQPVQIAKLLADDGAGSDTFGKAVALSDSMALVAAPLDDDHGSESGSAYLFDISTGQQIHKLIPDDSAVGDEFGYDVAIDGSTVLVAKNRAAAYVFDALTGAQLHKVLPVDGASSGGKGASVALRGSTAIVGAPPPDEPGPGYAYVFDVVTGQETLRLYGEHSFDSFGTDVDLHDNVALVGAPGGDTAYQFSFDDGAGWADLGAALPGTQGRPSLEGAGLLRESCPFHLLLSNAAPVSATTLIVGLTKLSAPFLGGVLVPSPDVRVQGLTDVNGDLLISTPLPTTLPPSITLYFQHWIVDPEAPQGVAASNALSVTAP